MSCSSTNAARAASAVKMRSRCSGRSRIISELINSAGESAICTDMPAWSVRKRKQPCASLSTWRRCGRRQSDRPCAASGGVALATNASSASRPGRIQFGGCTANVSAASEPLQHSNRGAGISVHASQFSCSGFPSSQAAATWSGCPRRQINASQAGGVQWVRCATVFASCITCRFMAQG